MCPRGAEKEELLKQLTAVVDYLKDGNVTILSEHNCHPKVCTVPLEFSVLADRAIRLVNNLISSNTVILYSNPVTPS